MLFMKTFKEVELHAPGVIVVKVNCQIDSTRFAVISRIYRKVLGFLLLTRELLFARFSRLLLIFLFLQKRSCWSPLTTLITFVTKGMLTVMYSLLRAHEQYPGAKIGIIGIVNDISDLYCLDSRVNSVFT